MNVRLRWSKLLLVALLLGVGRAQAQLVIEKVEWGEGGEKLSIVAEQQTIMRLWISSPTAWSGIISVKFPQDATQDGRYTTRAATTPGTAVPVEFPVCLPWSAGDILIDATDGRKRQFWKLSDRDEQSPDFQLPAREIGLQTVLIVGESSAARWITQANPMRPDVVGGTAPASVSDDDLDRQMLTEMAMVRFETSPLLSSRWWSRYDAYDVVIVQEEAFFKSPRVAQAALMEWVRAGGRLIVAMSGASDRWSQCLPDATPLPLTATDAEVLSPGASVTEAATRAYPPDMLKAARREPSLRDAPARRLKLTPQGLAMGWKVAWQAKDAGLNEGWLAHGPVEFGMVGFLGVDPEQVSPAVETTLLNSTQILWRDAIGKIAWPNGLGAERTNAMSNGWWLTPSAPTIAARESLRRLLDDMVVRMPIGTGLFTAVFASMLALALLVGPVDAIVLKRLRLRHRSYLTALAWIGIAAAITWKIPSMVRSGSTSYSHLVVEDVVMDLGTPVRSVHEGLVGVFAGRPGVYPLPECAPGSMWRGVTAMVDAGGRFKIASPLELAARELPSGVLGHEMQPMKVGQWAFRSAQYQEPVRSDAAPVTASVRRDDFGMTVTLHDVPAGASFVKGTLELGGKYFGLTVGGRSARDLALTVSSEAGLNAACIDEFAPTLRDASHPGWTPPAGTVAATTAQQFLTHPVSTAFSLWKPSRREHAIDARLKTGRYACLYVRLKDVPIPGDKELASEPQSILRGLRFIRIAVPLDDALAKGAEVEGLNPADAAFDEGEAK